nr:CS1-pili formation C-terminal domain-containing protein [Escherichia coli]
MPLRRFSPGLKAQFAFGMVFLFVQPDASAADISAQQIGGVIIPQAFSQALQDGMSVPLYIHLAGSQGRQDDQRIGSAFIWLDDGQLRIRKIQLEESEDNASVSEQTRQQLMALANAPFNEALTIPLTDNAQLDLSLRQLLLQLVVKREALGTVLRSRSEDIGQSSVNTLSSNLSYNLGVYNNQLRNGGSISATLPGGFSSLWVNQEKTRIGNQLRRSDADNRAIGGTLNLNSLWSKLGTFSISYNDDRRYNSHYYTADYYQNVYSGTFGSLGLRAGIQRYNNGDSNANTGKYIALDLSLPLGNWFSAGMTHQNGYTMANLSARKQFDEGTIRTVGANLSRAISGDTGDDKTLSGGAYAQFDARYASGTLNVNSAADGYINTNLTANGSVGWQGKNIAASGRTDGNAGVIFNTGLEDDGQISAKINGRIFPLNGKRNYLPLSPYGRYEVELQNSKNSLDSYDIVSGRKSHLTLYPGNVAVIEPEVKQMVTVSGRIRAEDGTLLANARINNHIGRTRTDENGEFVMDVDKKYPTIDFRYSGNKTCEVALELNQARGAVWVGDVVCSGLSSWAAVTQTGEENES